MFSRISAPRSQMPQNLPEEIRYCRVLFPRAEDVNISATEPPHFEIYTTKNKTKTLSGYAFRTTQLVPDIQGYAGPIDLLVGIDLTGTIQGIYLISHQETPAYAKDRESFLEQFLHRGPGDPLRLGQDIDAITQATITSSAITRSIKESLQIMGRDVLSQKPVHSEEQTTVFPWDQLVVPAILFLLAGLSLFLKRPQLRWLALVGGFIYLGVWKGTMVAATHVANIGLLNFPEFSDSPLWYALMTATIASGFMLGMLYCGSICPFAAAQEFLFKMGQKLFKYKLCPSEKIDARAKYFKYLLLLGLLAVSLAWGNPDIANVEVYVTLFTRHGTALAWTLLGLMMLTGLFQYRFWCRYFCPIGAMNGLCSSWSLFKIQINETCNLCRHCRDICPTQAIRQSETQDKIFIDHPECILCQKCLLECPQGAVSFTSAKHEKKR